MRIRRRGVILALAALPLLAGCAPKEPAAPTGEATKTAATKPKIALVMKSRANEFFLTMENGAKKYQSEHADQFELTAVGIKDEQDLAQQQSLVEQVIAQGVQAIVIAPADSKALVPVCKRALDAGIVVVNIDNRLDAEVLKVKGAAIPFVGPDNRKGARLAGDRLARTLKAGDSVAILEGIPTAFNAQQRKAGFEDAIKEAKLKLVASQSANWETDAANKAAAALLTAHPDLKALLCANDSMALGAVAAVKAAGKTGAVQVVGFDNISAIQELIRSGAVLCTVDQHGDQLAVYGIQYALEILAKKGTPADRETAVDLIDKIALAPH